MKYSIFGISLLLTIYLAYVDMHNLQLSDRIIEFKRDIELKKVPIRNFKRHIQDYLKLEPKSFHDNNIEFEDSSSRYEESYTLFLSYMNSLRDNYFEEFKRGVSKRKFNSLKMEKYCKDISTKCQNAMQKSIPQGFEATWSYEVC